MIGELFRIGAWLATRPIALAGDLLHGWMTGGNAVLDVVIERQEDGAGRRRLVDRLKRAAKDPKIVALILRFHSAPGSWATCHDVREAIHALRRADKKVYGYVEAPGNVLVWLASACDRVFILPTGEVTLLGVGVEMNFFGRLLERLGIQPDFEAAGAYKSFGEPFKRTYPSSENHEAVSALIEDLHDQLITDLVADRGCDPEALQAALDMAPLTAEEAIEVGLVDQLAYEDYVLTWIREQHDEPRILEFASWSKRIAILEWLERLGVSGPKVAVVHLEGAIVMDDRGAGVRIRARRVVPELRRLREDDQVDAVVLSVNSPGGSALASDLIWREVELLRKKKPVVACFDNVAASGGYYLAAPAQEIIARPTTLTGSIGVFGGKMVVGGALRHLSVTTYEVSAAPNATVYSPVRSFNDPQRKRFRVMLQRTYDGFVKRVADGRKTSEEEVEPHCRGRVWTGRQALTHNLVDRYGTLDDALDRARTLAGLYPNQYRRIDITPAPKRTLLNRIVHQAVPGMALPPGARAALRLMETAVGGQISPSVEVVLEHPGEPLALMPFDIKVH